MFPALANCAATSFRIGQSRSPRYNDERYWLRTGFGLVNPKLHGEREAVLLMLAHPQNPIRRL
jgi:hypothetical protein